MSLCEQDQSHFWKLVMGLFTRHPYHLVDNSPWPKLSSFAAFGLTVGLVNWFYKLSFFLIIFSILNLLLVSFQWWRDVSREASYIGYHSKIVELGIRWGIVIFIASEVLFFVSFFWTFFYLRLVPGIEIGATWPPIGIKPFNPLGVPLLNSIILLISGVSVTWSHHGIISKNHTERIQSLVITIILGYYFTSLQALEYWEARFTFRDRSYGRVFYIATGFHGLHVIVGSKFLLVRLVRISKGLFRESHHTGFEIAAWYWHFVDVVWLFLYIWIYIWGK